MKHYLNEKESLSHLLATALVKYPWSVWFRLKCTKLKTKNPYNKEPNKTQTLCIIVSILNMCLEIAPFIYGIAIIC